MECLRNRIGGLIVDFSDCTRTFALAVVFGLGALTVQKLLGLDECGMLLGMVSWLWAYVIRKV